MTASIHIADGAAQERAKYSAVWDIPEYRVVSPGADNVDRFLEVLQPPRGSTVIDIGCGVGNAGLDLERHGMNVTWLDITDAALDPVIDRRQFIEAPLWARWQRPGGWDYGFCVDVMEHLPVEYTMLALERIVLACRTSWICLANLPDSHGDRIGETLHLTVQPFNWWLVRVGAIGKVVDARDICGRSVFVVER